MALSLKPVAGENQSKILGPSVERDEELLDSCRLRSISFLKLKITGEL